MKILVRLPNWLGDAVMATYGLEFLFLHFPKAQFYFVGSPVSVGLFTHYPNVITLLDTSKTQKSRILALYKLAKEIPPCDIALTLQNNFLSALFLAFNGAKFRTGFSKEMRGFLLNFHPKKPKQMHEAQRFATLIQESLKIWQQQTQQPLTPLGIPQRLYLRPKFRIPRPFPTKIAGISAGAAFGAAKRWNEAYFAEVIAYLLSQNYSIILFGSANESAINASILAHLSAPKASLECILNVAGQTDVPTLVAYLLHLDILVTNDSGPMHVAAALEIPTLALFGPTNAQETSPFCAKNAHILSLETLGQKLPCMPCMQRTCPFPKDSTNYHSCMVNLAPKFAIDALQTLLKKKV